MDRSPTVQLINIQTTLLSIVTSRGKCAVVVEPIVLGVVVVRVVEGGFDTVELCVEDFEVVETVV